MRKKIITGNWKMNADKNEAVSLVNGLLEKYGELNLSENKIVVIAPPFPYIHYISSVFIKHPYFFAGAQNCSEYEKGAYTGEVSAKIIASLDVKYVIIGHSERRQYFRETDEILLQKIYRAQKEKLIPIFCCGESLESREAGDHFTFIKKQLDDCVFHLTEEEFGNIVIAYEPIWAIGTGKTASPEQAQEVHQFIRQQIKEKYSESTAEQTTILYGGSVTAKNASELFAEKDIDGGLVGGASLKADEFAAIIKA
ncbi:MAG: triose-phosphate isomerase [Bacteroidota bacterium]|nr:triose-phosphate isomerase [Bacteroidota bacterium]